MDGANHVNDRSVTGSQSSGQPGETAAPQSAAPESAEQFRMMYGLKQAAPSPATGESSPMTNMADLIGQAAGGLLVQQQQQPQPGQAENAAVQAPVASAAPSAVDMPRCEEIVERILVSQPSEDGSAEVRIKIDKSWLPDTEVKIVRAPDGKLAVDFETNEIDSQRFLLPNLTALRERLSDRTGQNVTVRMTEQGEADADTGDGRSRNRRNLYEEQGDQ